MNKQPAHIIIKTLGGAKVVSEVVNKNASTIHRWTYEKSIGGTGGFIPYTHHEALLEYAKSETIDLIHTDFLSADRLLEKEKRQDAKVGAAA